jgi:hypothetical protein
VVAEPASLREWVAVAAVTLALYSFLLVRWGAGSFDALRGQALLVVIYIAAFEVQLATKNELGWPTLAYVLYATVAVIWMTGFWRQWIVWRTWPKETRASIAVGTVAGGLMLVLAFSAVTGVLLNEGFASSKPAPDGHVFLDLETHYAWQVTKAIPGLDATDTLHWSQPHELGGATGGALLLIFKILVILPVLGLVKYLLPGRGLGAPAPAP